MEIGSNSHIKHTFVSHSADDSYVAEALVPMASETHAGEDVAIYAAGPMSHMFRGVVEQNYVPHAMAYASCVGEYTSCEWLQVKGDRGCTNGSAAVEYVAMVTIFGVYMALLFTHYES